MTTRILVLTVLFMTILSHHSGAGDAPADVYPTGLRTIVFVSPTKYWTMEELNRQALEFLWKDGTMVKGTIVEASVSIFLHDKTVMCEFTYSQGFEKPFWTVKVGHDGKIIGYDKSTLKEMHH